MIDKMITAEELQKMSNEDLANVLRSTNSKDEGFFAVNEALARLLVKEHEPYSVKRKRIIKQIGDSFKDTVPSLQNMCREAVVTALEYLMMEPIKVVPMPDFINSDDVESFSAKFIPNYESGVASQFNDLIEKLVGEIQKKAKETNSQSIYFLDAKMMAGVNCYRVKIEMVSIAIIESFNGEKNRTEYFINALVGMVK